jgi:hypothetical protein
MKVLKIPLVLESNHLIKELLKIDFFRKLWFIRLSLMSGAKYWIKKNSFNTDALDEYLNQTGYKINEQKQALRARTREAYP